MFDSCSAYQPHVLYLSHCVPNPPDKGERIRAFHEVRQLAARFRVHVVCFARDERDLAASQELRATCASVTAVRLRGVPALAKAALSFAAGRCLTTSFYGHTGLRAAVEQVRRRVPLAATVVYSSAMAQYAPADVPYLLDLVDVDSEKWMQYASMRRPGWAYRREGGRLRQREMAYAGRARHTFLATTQETALFRSFAPHTCVTPLENGVDFNYFQPGTFLERESSGQPGIVFIGAMDYYPNADGVLRFAATVLPELQREEPDLRFVIAGRNPTSAVRQLARQPGIEVTGSVPDVRPYLAQARAVVAPLRIARGIQNKVLEALAMGKPVLASPAVCRTFGADLPQGVVCCEQPTEYAAALAGIADHRPQASIRNDARRRFCWETNLQQLLTSLDHVLATSLVSTP